MVVTEWQNYRLTLEDVGDDTGDVTEEEEDYGKLVLRLTVYDRHELVESMPTLIPIDTPEELQKQLLDKVMLPTFKHTVLYGYSIRHWLEGYENYDASEFR